jgi:hypothetical protein
MPEKRKNLLRNAEKGTETCECNRAEPGGEEKTYSPPQLACLGKAR